MEKFEIQKRIEEEIAKLLSLSEEFIEKDLSVHEIEKSLLSQLLRLGLILLSYIITQKIGRLKGDRPSLASGEAYEEKGKSSRKYLSLFGLLDIGRPSSWSKSSGKFHIADERLNLPIGSYWSYNLQDLVGENASENDFRESIRILNKLLGLNLSGKSSQRNAEHLGKMVDSFYESQAPDVELSAKCFSASFDGKGVTKIKRAKKKEGNPKKRLGKGQKRGVMQMATVAVTSRFEPKQQSVQGIIRGLMESPLSKVERGQEPEIKSDNDNRWHKKIHRRAFLADQEKAVDYGIKQIKDEMKNPNSRFVVPIDAGIGLEDKVLECVEKHELKDQFDGFILDIIHVSEYGWKAGTAIFGEKSKVRTPWVTDLLTDLLNSKTEQVITDLIRIRDKTKLSKNKKEQVDKTITYFSNHKHKMDYKTFIEKGYPVSSALVESACGHLVKERMEQSGMRWSSQGAQNIMDLRAVKLNDDMEDFMQFVIQQDRKVDFAKAA